MRRAYLDTNILLDVASDRRPGHHSAVNLFGDPELVLGISAGSLKDFYYIAGSARSNIGDGEQTGMSDAIRREYIRFFLATAELISDDRDICVTALNSDEPDYEDGTKRAAAEDWGADWIVSRDARRHAFEHSPIPRVNAMDLESPRNR